MANWNQLQTQQPKAANFAQTQAQQPQNQQRFIYNNGFNPFLGQKKLSNKQNSNDFLKAATYNGDYNFANQETPFSQRNAERAIARDTSVSNNQFDSLSGQTDSQFYRNGLGGQGVHQASQQQLNADRASQIANQASNIRETYNQNDYMTRWGQLTQFWQNRLNLSQIQMAYENMRQQMVAQNKAEDAQKRAQQQALLGGILGAFTGGIGSLFSGGSKS